MGQPGLPQPGAKPKGPKLKFTPEDDALLIKLKETTDLMWKQVADFFPGRSPGTLQVRYCTKLKAKSTVWTEDMVGVVRCFPHARRFYGSTWLRDMGRIWKVRESRSLTYCRCGAL